MAKEVILMTPVDGLGTEGEVVRVAEGYARNYLLPQGKAALVTPGTRRLVEKKKAERLAREAADREAAQELAKRLGNVSVTLSVKTGEGGKLFGSVTATDVLTALEKQGITLDKKPLQMAAPLRELGVFDLPCKLHDDVLATCKVWLVEE